MAAVQIVAVAALLAYAAHSGLGLGAGLQTLFEDWVFNGLIVTGAGLCLLRAAWVRKDRIAWGMLGLGLGSWAAGEILLTLEPTILDGGFPSVSDWLWLLFYPAGFAALTLLVRSRVREFYAALWLDGLLGAFALGALTVQFVFPPIVAQTGTSGASVVADLIYPVGDVLLLVFVLGALALTGWRPGWTLGLVAGGFALSAVADGWSLYSSATGNSGSTVLDSLWPASGLVLGCAAWQRHRRAAGPVQLDGKRLLAFPSLFALVGLGLLGLNAAHRLHPVAYALALATIAGVAARMVVTFTENFALVRRTREESLTDSLTGLGNRRRLMRDLAEQLEQATLVSPRTLIAFDLNGFKRYNDTFGHPAGDALLATLGCRLADAVRPYGAAYRLGGDEFCVLAGPDAPAIDTVLAATAAALTEEGGGFDVTTAFGHVALPLETADAALALQISDQRLYENKGPRGIARDRWQPRDVLLKVLQERQPDLHKHINGVADLAQSVGRRLELSGEELEEVTRAAELHDVGKAAIPDAILEKPAPLDEREMTLMREHTIIGERILAAAPALRAIAKLVRFSHERFDGSGYPDCLSGKDIPLGARIIAVCDAFEAMTSDRPYRRSIGVEAALEELRRNAGTQFDPEVVEAFCAAMSHPEAISLSAPCLDAVDVPAPEKTEVWS